MNPKSIKGDYRTNCKHLLGDLHTPVSIYLKVRDMYPQSVLMESSDFHAGENSLSFIALCPLASIGINRGIVTMSYPDNSKEEVPLSDMFTVADALNGFIGRFKITGENVNVCGLYGYTTFNAVKYFEQIPIKESWDETNDAPDILYILYKYIILFNHFKNELTLVELLSDGEASGLSELEAEIGNRNYASYNFSVKGAATSTLTDEEHKANVRRGVAHCHRGDVFQIVLSRRFVQPYVGDDFKVYRALRSINPSPYLFYFDFGGYRIFGSSPETHCKIEGKQVCIDPIAGTTYRTGDEQKDKELAEALLADPKENAEHTMLFTSCNSPSSRLPATIPPPA
ncbi:Anthranilate synthase component 1 [termite gut metagenome]|uniref:Anthranilate synthase component 1 n=1 Tax=termite gut metagenome TaxID=433724 RepID=A0A5J4Q6Q4_9ZZZZ